MVEVITTLRADSIIESGSRNTAIDFRLPQESVTNQTPCLLKKNFYQRNNLNKPVNDIWQKVKTGIELEKTETELAGKRCRAGRQVSGSSRGRVRDLVAVKAGFKSANSYVAAKTVYLNAHHEIKKIVDDGIIKITPASKIAKLDLTKQAQYAKIIRLMSITLENRKRAVSFFITTVLSENNQNIESLVTAIINGIQNGESSFKRILDNYMTKEKPGDESKPEPHMVKAISRIHESLGDLVISASEIARMDADRVRDLDRKLSHIEKIAKNLRKYLREKSTVFEDSFNDSVLRYRSQFIESVQFFAHTLSKNLDNTNEDLLSDLHRTFHNSTTILYNVAAVTARQIRF